MSSVGEKLHESISGGLTESDTIVCAYQQFSNFLLRLSSNWFHVSSQLSSEIIEPFQIFLNNFRLTNKTVMSEGKVYIRDIQQAHEQLGKAQQEYWKLMHNAEKGFSQVEKIVEGVEKGQKNKDDLIRASERSVKLKEVAQESQ